jgi:hypothetical protein
MRVSRFGFGLAPLVLCRRPEKHPRSNSLSSVIGIFALLTVTGSKAATIELVCGDEYRVSIDTEKKIVNAYQPGNHAIYIDTRIVQLPETPGLGYIQSVKITNSEIQYGDWISPNADFQAAVIGKCESTVIDRTSGLVTQKMGCMAGGTINFQARCVPGRAGPFEKKF